MPRSSQGGKGDSRGSTVFRGMSLIGEKARLSGSLRGAESHESEGTGTPIQDRPWGLKVSFHY